MRRRERLNWQDETGSAIVEFTMLGVILLVPLIYVVLTMGQLQAASYAAAAAADHGAQVFAAASTQQEGAARARAVAAQAAENMGLPPTAAAVEYTCHVQCSGAGGAVTVHVAVAIQLPLMPASLDASVGTVSAESTRLLSGEQP